MHNITNLRQPRGMAHPVLLRLGISMILAGVLIGLISALSPSSAISSKKPVVLLAGASLRPAIEAVTKAYQSEYGVEIQVQYDTSENLLSSIRLAKTGDLYLPAEEYYLERGREFGVVREVLPIGHTRPIIAVKKGNPKHITSLRDFLRPDVAVALASPSAAIGRLSHELLQKSGDWEDFQKRRNEAGASVAELGKEPEVANSILLGAVDAGIIWESSVGRYKELEGVTLPLFADFDQRLSVCVLDCSQQPTRALHFARYLTAADRGLLEFEKKGYHVANGDHWDDHPQLLLYAGAMLRPAITDTIKDFERREGLPPIQTVFNGCGILVGQMKVAGVRPDAYFSCDNSFMNQVRNLYEAPIVVSSNMMVILVAKGNPKGIHSLNDLTKSGLKLGMGDENQCALGFLTKTALDVKKICEAVQKNIAVRSPTGDFLVNQMRTGSLDAVVVYESNATFCKDVLDEVPVDGEQNIAYQPVAVGKTTKYKQLTQRLLDALRSAKSAERFKANGFQWLVNRDAPK